MALKSVSSTEMEIFLQNFPIKYESQENFQEKKYYAKGFLIAEFVHALGEEHTSIDEQALIELIPPNSDFYGTLNIFWDKKRNHTVVEREKESNLQLHFYSGGEFKRVLYRNKHTRYKWTEGAIFHRSAQSLLADYKIWKIKSTYL